MQLAFINHPLTNKKLVISRKENLEIAGDKIPLPKVHLILAAI